ncbi:hypothetical protein ACRC7T_17750 [Segnochrobactraceae bacterium EtOH-i3]
MKRRAVVAWDEIRRLYEAGGVSAVGLATLAGVSAPTIRRRARSEGWQRADAADRLAATEAGEAERGGAPRGSDASGRAGGGSAPEPPADRAALIAGLYRACAAHVADIESRVGVSAQNRERDARTLGILARTLDTLIDLDRRKAGEEAADPEADIERLRADLAGRLARLVACP